MSLNFTVFLFFLFIEPCKPDKRQPMGCSIRVVTQIKLIYIIGQMLLYSLSFDIKIDSLTNTIHKM